MDEKRIVIRVDPKTWRLYDDKRHSERRSFQQLGMDLLRRWYEGGLTGPASAGVEKPHTNFPKTLTCPHCESTLSVSREGIAEVMEPKSVPGTEKARTDPENVIYITNPRERECAEKLLYILRHDPDTAEALHKNLDRFELLTRILAGDYGTSDRPAGQIPADHDTRMERVRQLGARYLRGRGDSRRDEGGLPTKKAKPLTGTEGGRKDRK